jgi:putative membrane protein
MSTDNRGLLIVLGVLILIVLVGPLLGGGMMGSGMMGVGRGLATGGGWTWGLLMALGGLSMLAFWGALIVGIVLLIRVVTGPSSGQSSRSGEPAIEILKRRYAAGEITGEEYEQMRKTLES